MSIPFSSVSLPVIRTKDNSWRYQMTAEDMITLARSIRLEEGRSASVDAYGRILWCYAQRLYMLRDAISTMQALVQAHSQPINPLWFPDGPRCCPTCDWFRERCATPAALASYRCGCKSAAQRPANARYPWDEMSPATQEGVARWARGDVPNAIPRGVDFAAVALVAEKIAGRNPEGFHVVHQGPPGNTVVSTTRSRAWPSDDWIVLEVNGKVVGVDPAFRGKAVARGYMTLGLFGGAYAAWKAWRGR